MKAISPSAVKMLRRAMDPREKCVVVIDNEGFRAVPSNIHQPRPTVLTMSASTFVKEIQERTGKPLSKILGSAAPDAILGAISRELFREKSGLPPMSFSDTRGRIW